MSGTVDNLWIPQARRTKEDIQRQADDLYALLMERNMRAEELARIKDVPVRFLERPLKLLRNQKKIVISGEKRWTEYSVSSVGRH